MEEEFNNYQRLLFKKAFEIKKLVEGIASCAQKKKKKPYLPTGFPGADIFLVKLKPAFDESRFLWEGEEGRAMMKAFERLDIPLYKAFGTAAWKCQNCWDNCPYLFQELVILEPEKILAFGKETVEKLSKVLHIEIEWKNGKIFHFPFTSIICLPDLRVALNDKKGKAYLWQKIKNFLKED